MSDGELLESLDRHFVAGCACLSAAQLREHRATGACCECRVRAMAMMTGAREKAAPGIAAKESGR